jgi:Fe-S cluster assembly protein SufD
MSADVKIRTLPKHSPYHPETAERVLAGWPSFMATMPQDPQWLADLRSGAAEYLRHRGLPTAKLEGWTFTNLLPLVKSFGDTLGQARVTYEQPFGVRVEPLITACQHDWVREILSRPVPMHDANADPALWHVCKLFFRDGVAIDVAPGVEVEGPLDILMECGDDALYAVHTAIRVQRNARLTIVEDHRGKGAFWKNALSHISVEEGAHLVHIRIQDDSRKAVYTQTTDVEVAKEGTYEAITLYTGARMSRNQVHVKLKEPGAACHLNAVAMMRGEQHADTTILVEHLAPHCQSNQNMRTILDDRAHGVFQGKIHVHQPAQKTDGYQLSKALLLSEGAEMDTKPELEIYADDVKCSHGATTGQLDQEPMFYMRSRGIPEDEARALLIQSFVASVFEGVKDEGIRERLMAGVREWLK